MAFLGKKIIAFLILFLIITQVFVITAHEEISIKNEAINPGSFYYSFKRLWEKSWEMFVFTQSSKVSFHQSLLKTRLVELNYVVENKLLGEVQTSSERFAYTAGRLTEELLKENERSSASNKGKENLVKEFEEMQKFLDKLRDHYPANSSFWMLIQHDINTLKILSDQLK